MFNQQQQTVDYMDWSQIRVASLVGANNNTSRKKMYIALQVTAIVKQIQRKDSNLPKG